MAEGNNEIKECVFCKVIDGEEPKEIISEGENTISILSNPSQIRGHCLVMPKRHVEKLSELNKKELDELMQSIIYIEELLLKKHEGCDIKQNYRPFLKDSKHKISHLHFHVQPRHFQDNLFNKTQTNEKNIFRDLSKEKLKEIKKEILENG